VSEAVFSAAGGEDEENEPCPIAVLNFCLFTFIAWVASRLVFAWWVAFIGTFR
jgi:hypothetical protein